MERVVPKEEPWYEGQQGQRDPPGSGGGGLPAARQGAAGCSEDDNCVISLLDDSESEDLSDEGNEADDWDVEDASEDESDVEPCAAGRPGSGSGRHERSQPVAAQGAAAGAAAQADGKPAAAGEEEAAPLLNWEAYPSLARTAGKEPPGRTSGLQNHKTCQGGIVVQMAVPASTGTVCPHTVGVFSCRQVAARARDVGHAWRALHGIERATWESCQWAYPEAGYQSDAALLAALRPLTQFRQLRAAVRQLFPPPLSLRQGRMRGDRSKSRRGDGSERRHVHWRHRAVHVDPDNTAVDKLMSAAALSSSSVRFRVQDFQLLGWKGGREHVPRLLITLCDGAEPAAQQGDSPLSPGSRGRSPLEVEFGVMGRDGARMATASAVRLLSRLSLRVGDVLRFRPAPAGAGSVGEGRLAAQLTVVRTQEEEQGAAAAPAAAQGAAAGNSGGQAGSHRRKGVPARVDGGLRWVGDAAEEAPEGADVPAAGEQQPLVCANCGCTATYAWRPFPGSKRKKLCGTCRAYCDNHGGKMRPPHRWAPWKPREVKTERAEGAEGVQQEPPAKRHKAEQPAASPAGAAAQAPPEAGTPPARQQQGMEQQHQQQQQQQQADAPGTAPPAASAAAATPPAGAAPPAAAAAAARSEGLLPADASWERCHARLDVLLSECGVDDLDAQDFKFALLGMPEEVRRSHFLEIQARHAEGKVALACRWVARVLGK